MWFDFVIHELIHFSLSLLVAVLFIKKLGWGRSLLIGLGVGIFLDLDHFFDYGLYLAKFGGWPSPAEFVSGSYFDYNGKLYIPFHSWEASILLTLTPIVLKFLSMSGPFYLKLTSGWGSLNRFQLSIVLAGLAVAGHLFFDQLVNNVEPMTYFLIYRFSIGFVDS